MKNHPSALLLGIVLVFSSACHQSTRPLPGANADRLVQTPPGSQESLILGEAELVPGTTVFRANLSVNREEGFSSKGSYFETRNILFIDPSDKAAHWLLPDTKHVIESATDIGESRAGIGDPARPSQSCIKHQYPIQENTCYFDLREGEPRTLAGFHRGTAAVG